MHPHASETSSPSSGLKSNSGYAKSDSKGKSRTCSCTYLASLQPTPTNSDLLSVVISAPLPQGVSSAKELKGHKAQALLDSGALAADYINSRIVSTLPLVPVQSVNLNRTCSGLDGVCSDTSSYTNCTLTIQTSNGYINLNIVPTILNKTPFDLILGRPTIKKYQLATLFPNHFRSSTALAVNRSTSVTALSMAASGLNTQNRVRLIKNETPVSEVLNFYDPDPVPVEFEINDGIVGQHSHEKNPTRLWARPEVNNLNLANLNISSTRGKSSSMNLHANVAELVTQTQPPALRRIYTKAECFDQVDDDDEIDYEIIDAFGHWPSLSGAIPGTDPLDTITIDGSPAFRLSIRALCEDYRDVFSNDLPDSPADLEPFNLIVDDVKWKTNKNRTPPRMQSTLKNDEIQKQITKLLASGIIVKSEASYYSEVLLIKKPNSEEFRMCIDFRPMNACTEPASFPIPIIMLMLQRIGRHRSHYFGIIDLTNGYHQIALTKSARPYTAFIAFCGVFEYTRIPFGPKRAPSWFQMLIGTVVLLGLLYVSCEAYLDDIIVHAKTEQEFLNNLRQILIRFRKYNVKAKPSKCRFGLSSIEYVGRVISHEGLTMTNKKINKVLDFPKPETAGQLYSFIGLLNYFRDHIENHSIHVKPLYELIPTNSNRKKVPKHHCNGLPKRTLRGRFSYQW